MAGKRDEILAVLLVLIVAVATATGGVETGRRLRPAEYSRDELESIDLFMVLLLRFAAASLALSLALPVAVPLLVGFISSLFN